MLLQSATAFGLAETVSEEIDQKVADMVNLILDYGLRDDDYKAICEDEINKRPADHHVLAPAECNPQILDVLQIDIKKD